MLGRRAESEGGLAEVIRSTRWLLESSDEADRVSAFVLAALDLPSAAKAKAMNEACEPHENKMMAGGARGAQAAHN